MMAIGKIIDTGLRKERLLYVSFALYLLSRQIEILAPCTLSIASWNQLATIFQVGALVLLVPLILCKIARLNWKSLALSAALFLPTVISALTAHSYYLLWGFIYIFSAHDISIKSLARMALAISVAVLGLGFLLNMFGLASEAAVTRGDSVRYLMGFAHPNSLAKVILLAMTSWLILRFDKLRVLDAAACLLVGIATYLLTKSRTALVGFIATAVLYGGMRLVRPKSSARRVIAWGAVILFCVTAATCLTLPAIFSPDSQILSSINQMLSGRIYFPFLIYNNVPLGLFGTDISALGQYLTGLVALQNNTLPIDNVYCNVFIQFGPIVLALLLFIYGMAIRQSLTNDNVQVYAAGLLACALIGIGEVYAMDISFNLSLFYIGSLCQITAPYGLNSSRKS